MGRTAAPLPWGGLDAPGMRLFCPCTGQARRAPLNIETNIETHTPEDDDMTSDANSRARRALTRRSFLKITAGTTALLGALQSKFPFGVHIAEAAGPEVKKATLGFIALTDAAPLF